MKHSEVTKICNLNVLVKKKCVKIQQVLGFLSCVTLESYKTNKDAEGVYFSKTKRLIKGKDKINLCEYTKDCDKSKFTLTHQRISTSGFEEEYAQPFKCDEEEFVLEHNGIINQFKGEKGSDTYGYFYNHFLKEFKELKGSREKRIIKALKNTLSDCTGSYSIVLYDVKKDIMYYFKNTNKSITFFKSDDDNILYITTRSLNKNYLYFFDRKFAEMKIDDERIYRITSGKKIIVKKVGKIPKSPTKRTKTYSRNPYYNSYNNGNCYHGGYGRRPVYLKNSPEKKLNDIFSASKKISKQNNEELGHMFNEYWTDENTKKQTLEDSILDEFMDSGFTLRDLGFDSCKNSQDCTRCYNSAASFTDELNSPICLPCLMKKQDEINSDFLEAESYLNYVR